MMCANRAFLRTPEVEQHGELLCVVAAGLLGIFMLNEIILCQYRQVAVNDGGPQFCQLDNNLALYSGILLDYVVSRPDSRTKTL